MCSDFRNTGRQRDQRLWHWTLKTEPKKRQQFGKEQPTHNSLRQLLTLHEGTMLFSPNNAVIFDLILTIEPFFFYVYNKDIFPFTCSQNYHWNCTESSVLSFFPLCRTWTIKHIRTFSLLALEELIWNVKSSIYSGVWQNKILDSSKSNFEQRFSTDSCKFSIKFLFLKSSSLDAIFLSTFGFYPHLTFFFKQKLFTYL